jgi:hypothetical protein
MIDAKPVQGTGGIVAASRPDGVNEHDGIVTVVTAEQGRIRPPLRAHCIAGT